MLCFLLIEKRKRKKEMARELFSQGGHALLAVLCHDFPGC
jgi:hypothetical protein